MSVRSHAWRIGVLVALLLAACAPPPSVPRQGTPSDSPGGGTQSPTPGTTAKPTPTPPVVDPEPTDGSAEALTVTLDNGSGQVTTWTLSCDPADGDHPDPKAACAALTEHPEALRPVPPERQCTEQYGGPQTATVTGRWNGAPVSSRFRLTDGCEIARWEALAGLLPPAGA